MSNVLTDVAGIPLDVGDHVRYLGTQVGPEPVPVHVITQLAPAGSMVLLTDGDQEWPAIPATLRRVGAAVSTGETVSVGDVLYVLLSTNPMIGEPVYGGELVDLDPAEVRRVEEDLDSDPGENPDLSNVLRVYPRPYRTPNRVKPWRRAGGVA